jgi:hypothetical protein
MARFSEYVDSNYLPGEIRSAGLSDYQLSPQDKTEYMAKKLFKFQPGEDEGGKMFQRFLNLQRNPEGLMPQLPNTPFGNLGQLRRVVKAAYNKRKTNVKCNELYIHKQATLTD